MGHVLDKESKTEKHKLSLEVQVEISWILEENPDLSHIGEYTDKEEEGAIDCKEHGKNWTDRRLRWFVSENNAVHDPSNWDHVNKADKDECIKKYGSLKKTTEAYAMEDFKRMDGYNNDEWHMTGCKVKVRYGSLDGEDSIWGIESDCGDKYRRETEEGCISAAISALEKKILARLQVE